jgi:vacuolar-type H+-ATPase subunit H
MCIGLPILGAVLGIAQAAVGFMGAKAQADAQNAAHEQNRLNAIQAANDKYASINNKAIQERHQASAELLEKKIKAAQARSKAVVAAGEAGISGLSVDAVMGDIFAQEGRQTAAIMQNFETRQHHNADEMTATYHQTVGRIHSVRTAASPSPLPYIIQGLSSAVGSFKT